MFGVGWESLGFRRKKNPGSVMGGRRALAGGVKLEKSPLLRKHTAIQYFSL
jgi:hypothetical protein